MEITGTLYKVTILEMDRFMGSKIDEVKYFTEKVEAIDFCTEYNKDNVRDHAPDWYMTAIYEGRAS